MNSNDYTVVISRPAQKEIKSLDQVVRVRVLQALRALAADPRPSGCRKLVGAQHRWRIRVGDYRAIYAINDADKLIEVIAVRHRSKAYE
jgi:mRNA interferase RelE/StbE